MNRIIVGADISKKNFDVAYQKLNGKWSNCKFSNDQSGFEKLQSWIEKHNLSCITLAMESTGHYGEELAHYMYNHDYKVLVINPAQIKYYGQSKLSRAKTDKKDACLIAEFVMKNPDIKPWVPKAKSHKKHRALYQCLTNLIDDRAKCKNRLESVCDEDVKNTINTQIDFLTKSINDIESKIKDLISNDESLKENEILLQSIPGIGQQSSWGILAETPDISNFQHPKQLAAFAGLNPSQCESGSSVRGRRSISKMGSSTLRKLMFLPAMSAMQHNPIIKEFANHLYKNKDNGMIVVVACMRKLLHIIFGVLKKRAPFCKWHGSLPSNFQFVKAI